MKTKKVTRLLPAGFFFISTHHRATPWLILQNRGMSYEHLILYLTITIPGLIASPFVGMFLGNIIYEWFERVRARFSSYGENKTVIPDSEIINERTEEPLKIGTIFPSGNTGSNTPDKILQGFETGDDISVGVQPCQGDDDPDTGDVISKQVIERLRRKILNLD